MPFAAVHESGIGIVSRVTPVHTAVRNCTRDEGGPFEVSNQVLISSHRKLLSSKAMTASSAMLSKLKALPGALPAGTWVNADAFARAAINPMQFWVQFAEQWQKAWEWASADSAAAD